MSPYRCSRTDNGRPDGPPESIMPLPPQMHNKMRNSANNKCKTQRENNAQEFLGSGLSQYNVKIFSSLSKPETQTAPIRRVQISQRQCIAPLRGDSFVNYSRRQPSLMALTLPHRTLESRRLYSRRIGNNITVR